MQRTILVIGALILSLLLVSTAQAGKGLPASKHKMNREKLMRNAEAKVEEKNGIEVIKVNLCQPARKVVRKNGKKVVKLLYFTKWVCNWRAEGIYPGDIPYHCAGKAQFLRKSKSWRVEKCTNQLQVRSPLLPFPRPHVPFGYNDGWSFASQQTLDQLDRTGATVARQNLVWSNVEATRGHYNWHAMDTVYSWLTSRGIRPLFVSLSAPCWAQNRECNTGRPQEAHYDDLARFMAAAAQRYPLAVGFEVWNEPNYPRFWGGWPDAESYSKMLKASADAIHAAAPGVPVVSAGLSPHADTDKNAIGYRNFLEVLYERGAAQKADVIGIHPYPGVGPNDDYIDEFRVQIGKIRSVQAAFGDTATPLWITEIGISTTGNKQFTPQGQADALVNLYNVMLRTEGIEMFIVHSFLENLSLHDREGGFGVVKENGTPKPAYCALMVVRGLSC